MIKQQMAQLMLSGGLAAALWCSPAAAAPANSTAPFAVAQRYVLSGTEHWDYVAYDAPRHHLFISRANHVQVVDTVTGKLFGEIKGTDGVHGFAFVPDKNLGFITNGRADTITVVNLDTLQVVDTIKASGADPDGILYVPLLQRIYVSNGHANSVSAIDIATRKVIATVAVGGKPEALATDSQGRIFVNLEDKSEIAELDGNHNTVLAHWPLASCDGPSGLTIDSATERLFTVCSNQRMLVLDAQSGRQVASLPIGGGPDAAAFDSGLKTAFSSNGADGTLTAVHEDDPDHFSVVQNLSTQSGARTMALDEQTHTLYLVSSELRTSRDSAQNSPHQRGTVVSGTFVVLVVKRQQEPTGG
jgi:YVTN family beta-propeller protein